MPEVRHVLITGGAGFIGSWLVGSLVAAGHRITVIDDLSTGRLDNLSEFLPDRIRLLKGTVGDRLDDASDGDPVDAIYHLAAAVGVKLVVDDPVGCIETNVHETARVLRLAASTGCPTLLASTSEVYGKSEDVPFREDQDVVYGPSTESRWSYAYSKAVDEHLALGWHGATGLPVVIARFFNTVGPRQRGRWGMVLPRFVSAALRGEPLRVHGDGLQERCFADVRDVVPMLPGLLENPDAHGRVVNVGRDVPISIGALAKMVVDVLKSTSDIEHVAVEQDYGRSVEDMRRRQPDLTTLRSLVEPPMRHSLESTILDTAAMLQREMSA